MTPQFATELEGVHLRWTDVDEASGPGRHGYPAYYFEFLETEGYDPLAEGP